MTFATRAHPSLGFGTFYGSLDARCSAPGLDVAVLDADPHRIVERHSHADAHFVLVLDGLYVSSATSAPPVSSGRALIYNPAGTTHRDRFEARARTVEGRFLTVSIAAHMMNEGASVADSPETAIAIHDRGPIAIAERLAARDAGVHPVHLARVFRQYLGCSPGGYLRRRRLERSRALLRETDQSLLHIALGSGYADQSHFASAFKRDTSMTPATYRRLVNEERSPPVESRT